MRICFTGSHNAPRIKQEMADYMVSKGYTLDMLTMKTKNALDWKEDLKSYDIIVSNGEKYGPEVMDYLSGLKMISRCGIGYEEIDLEAAAQRGIAVTNCAGTMASGVAETALLLMLNLCRRFHEQDANVKAGKWQNGYLGAQLEGKTVGLAGFGSISQKLAQYLGGFSCKILAYDLNFNEDAAKRLNVTKATLDEIAAQSDFVSLHVPSTPMTKGMFNKDFFSKMKPTAYLVNTARGAVVKESDLVDALRSGAIAGAGLDVFEVEPTTPDNPLLKMDNVMLLPHIASATYESVMEASIRSLDNVIEFIEGKTVARILNPAYIDNVKK